MLSEPLQEVRKVYLEIEREGRVPTYSGDIITGNIMIMRSLNETVLLLDPLKVSYDSVEWLFRILRDANVMRAKVDELLRMAVLGEWSDQRLHYEYELRILHSNEHHVLDARRASDLKAYFDGGCAAFRAMLWIYDGDLCWPNSEHRFSNIPTSNKDLLHDKAQAKYLAHHNAGLWEAAKSSLGLDEDSPYYNLVAKSMIDAAIAYSGSPYYDDGFMFSAIQFLGLSLTPECQEFLYAFKKRMVA